jgi:ABC-type iron transport system FetAB permease component
VAVSTIGLTFSVQASYSDVRLVDGAIRLCLAAVALYILFSTHDTISTLASILVLGAIAYWLVVRRTRLDAGEPESAEAKLSRSAAARP